MTWAQSLLSSSMTLNQLIIQSGYCCWVWGNCLWILEHTQYNGRETNQVTIAWWRPVVTRLQSITKGLYRETIKDPYQSLFNINYRIIPLSVNTVSTDSSSKSLCPRSFHAKTIILYSLLQSVIRLWRSVLFKFCTCQIELSSVTGSLDSL